MNKYEINKDRGDKSVRKIFKPFTSKLNVLKFFVRIFYISRIVWNDLIRMRSTGLCCRVSLHHFLVALGCVYSSRALRLK